MVDEIVQDSAPEVATEGQENSQVETPAVDSPQQSNDTSVWKPFEETLGPIAFSSIKPELDKMSSAFNAKIADSNRRLEPWKQFDGVDPQELAFARQLMQEINTEPRAFYDKLHAYLLSTGQIEEAAAVAQAAEAAGVADDTEGEDPRIKQLQDQLDALTNGQNQMVQLRQAELQQQQYERELAAESSKLETSIQGLKDAGANDYDIKTVLERAQLHYFRTGQPADLQTLYSQWTQERGSLLDTPRPVDSAPRLPGSGGGVPQPGAIDYSKASRNESIDALAAFITQSKGN